MLAAWNAATANWWDGSSHTWTNSSNNIAAFGNFGAAGAVAISGNFTVSGIHNREPNSRPARQTDRLAELVGRHPGLWSGDFLFSAADVSNRWTMIRECQKQWNEGSLVQLMAHVAPPNLPEVCSWRGGVQSRLSDEQWKDLVTEGGALNQAWNAPGLTTRTLISISA